MEKEIKEFWLRLLENNNMNKKNTAPADTLLWRIAAKILYPFFDKILDIQVKKKKEIPEPPFLLIANHTHFLDGFFLSYAINKPISWVVAKGNFENKILNLALKGIGAIPKQKINQIFFLSEIFIEHFKRVELLEFFLKVLWLGMVLLVKFLKERINS
jgi:1-acyl-sn-glycerol-3-phosphate acyltransferase